MSGTPDQVLLVVYLTVLTFWLSRWWAPRPSRPARTSTFSDPPIPACGCWPEHATGGHPLEEYLPLIARDPRTGHLREVNKCSICGQPRAGHQ